MPANANFYEDVLTYQVPTSDVGKCAEKTTFNTKFTEAKSSLNTLRDRNNTCLPNTTKYREEINQVRDQKDNLNRRYNEQESLFTSYIAALDIVQKGKGPFDQYMADMEAEQAALEKEQYEIQQQIRAGRRRFLDADPQSGVKSILGLQTADDKILLAFWICFLLGLSAACAFLLLRFGDGLLLTIPQKTLLVLVVVLVCMGIAHTFIRKFG